MDTEPELSAAGLSATLSTGVLRDRSKAMDDSDYKLRLIVAQ